MSSSAGRVALLVALFLAVPAAAIGLPVHALPVGLLDRLTVAAAHVLEDEMHPVLEGRGLSRLADEGLVLVGADQQRGGEGSDAEPASLRGGAAQAQRETAGAPTRGIRLSRDAGLPWSHLGQEALHLVRAGAQRQPLLPAEVDDGEVPFPVLAERVDVRVVEEGHNFQAALPQQHERLDQARGAAGVEEYSRVANGHLASPSEQALPLAAGAWLAPQVLESAGRRHASPRGALQEPDLHEVGLVDLLKCVRLLADRRRQRLEPYGAPRELVDYRG